MPTSRMPALVALLGALALAGCARRAAAPARGPEATAARPALRVANEMHDRVDVYLIAETREWHLGRLEPGAARWLPLPAEASARGAGMVSLAVVAGAPRSLRPSREARAVVTARQPAAMLSGQRWTFAQGQLMGLRPHERRARGGAGGGP